VAVDGEEFAVVDPFDDGFEGVGVVFRQRGGVGGCFNKAASEHLFEDGGFFEEQVLVHGEVPLDCSFTDGDVENFFAQRSSAC